MISTTFYLKTFTEKSLIKILILKSPILLLKLIKVRLRSRGCAKWLLLLISKLILYNFYDIFPQIKG